MNGIDKYGNLAKLKTTKKKTNIVTSLHIWSCESRLEGWWIGGTWKLKLYPPTRSFD
jgi:hypothetical protein